MVERKLKGVHHKELSSYATKLLNTLNELESSIMRIMKNAKVLQYSSKEISDTIAYVLIGALFVEHAIWSNLANDVETCRLWQQKAHIYARPIGNIDENLSEFVYGKL